MAKLSRINRNNKVAAMTKKFAAKRAKLKAIVNNKKLDLEERFEATQKLASIAAQWHRHSLPQSLRTNRTVTRRCTVNSVWVAICYVNSQTMGYCPAFAKHLGKKGDIG